MPVVAVSLTMPDGSRQVILDRGERGSVTPGWVVGSTAHRYRSDWTIQTRACESPQAAVDWVATHYRKAW